MRLIERWSARVDARPLGFTRIAVGAAATLKVIILAPTIIALARPDTFRLPWLPGISPAVDAPLPVIALWGTAAIAFTMGFRTRTAGFLLAVTMALTLFSDRQLYSNHFYLLILLVTLLVVADSGAVLSIDARRRETGASVPTLAIDLLRVQLTLVYFYAAIWKVNDQFLSGWVLGSHLQNGLIAFPDRLRTPDVLAWLAAMAILLEMVLAFGLWFPRLRRGVAVIGVGLHVGFVLLIEQWLELVVFSAAMLAIYPLFFVNETPAAAS